MKRVRIAEDDALKVIEKVLGENISVENDRILVFGISFETKKETYEDKSNRLLMSLTEISGLKLEPYCANGEWEKEISFSHLINLSMVKSINA